MRVPEVPVGDTREARRSRPGTGVVRLLGYAILRAPVAPVAAMTAPPSAQRKMPTETEEAPRRRLVAITGLVAGRGQAAGGREMRDTNGQLRAAKLQVTASIGESG